MNHPDNNYHELLRQFEESNRKGQRIAPVQFVNRLAITPPHEFVLEIIAVDIEMTLARGIKPSLQKLLTDFPYLEDQIPDLFSDVVDTFVDKFCPVRSILGELKSTDEYEIEEEIDRGGMGVVYQAIQKSIGRKVALKVLFLARQDIFDEARKVAILNHRNICRIYEAGKIGDFPFMSMQLVRGESLGKRMQYNRPSIAEAIRIVIQIADGLATAHRSNLVHFDVKPENIVVGNEGHAWLMDFGLAKKKSELSLDPTRLQFASPAYSAPEQLSLQYGERGIRCDVYSLGLVLYELLTGRRAYDGDLAQIIDQLKHDPPRRPSDYDSAVSPELEAICLKAIEKQPGSRFASMAELRDQLTTLALKTGLDIHCGSSTPKF